VASVAVPVGVLVVGTTEDVPVGEAMLGVVLILPIQLMRVAVLYRAGPEMSSAGAWATLVLAVVATVGGDVVILTDDSSTAALGFLFFPPLIAGGVFAAHVADAAARFAVRALTKRG
jgi:hypothetical protein